MSLISDCCGACPMMVDIDTDTSEIGICPECGEHCEYIDDDEEEENI